MTRTGVGFKNEIGNKYGTLTVRKFIGKKGKSGHTSWMCECDCGGTHIATGTSLREGHVLHCKECRKSTGSPTEEESVQVLQPITLGRT